MITKEKFTREDVRFKIGESKASLCNDYSLYYHKISWFTNNLFFADQLYIDIVKPDLNVIREKIEYFQINFDQLLEILQ